MEQPPAPRDGTSFGLCSAGPLPGGIPASLAPQPGSHGGRVEGRNTTAAVLACSKITCLQNLPIHLKEEIAYIEGYLC